MTARQPSPSSSDDLSDDGIEWDTAAEATRLRDMALLTNTTSFMQPRPAPRPPSLTERPAVSKTRIVSRRPSLQPLVIPEVKSSPSFYKKPGDLNRKSSLPFGLCQSSTSLNRVRASTDTVRHGKAGLHSSSIIVDSPGNLSTRSPTPASSESKCRRKDSGPLRSEPDLQCCATDRRKVIEQQFEIDALKRQVEQLRYLLRKRSEEDDASGLRVHSQENLQIYESPLNRGMQRLDEDVDHRYSPNTPLRDETSSQLAALAEKVAQLDAKLSSSPVRSYWGVASCQGLAADALSPADSVSSYGRPGDSQRNLHHGRHSLDHGRQRPAAFVAQYASAVPPMQTVAEVPIATSSFSADGGEWIPLTYAVPGDRDPHLPRSNALHRQLSSPALHRDMRRSEESARRKRSSSPWPSPAPSVSSRSVAFRSPVDIYLDGANQPVVRREGRYVPLSEAFPAPVYRNGPTQSSSSVRSSFEKASRREEHQATSTKVSKKRCDTDEAADGPTSSSTNKTAERADDTGGLHSRSHTRLRSMRGRLSSPRLSKDVQGDDVEEKAAAAFKVRMGPGRGRMSVSKK
ncbi:unnamed protein product [Jaminaea pallidilutea]